MKQVNFVLIFIICLAFVVFAIQNTEPGTIHIIPGLQVQAPISVELLLAFGLGGVFAWLFSIWTQLLRYLISIKQVRQKNIQIKELENKVQQYQAEIKSLQPTLPPASDSKEAQKLVQ